MFYIRYILKANCQNVRCRTLKNMLVLFFFYIILHILYNNTTLLQKNFNIKKGISYIPKKIMNNVIHYKLIHSKIYAFFLFLLALPKSTFRLPQSHFSGFEFTRYLINIKCINMYMYVHVASI